MLPLADCPRTLLASLRGLLTDFDGTLTDDGRLPPEAYAALSELKESGLFVAIVTGRPAGWGELLARSFPIDACIVENGGLTFARDRRGGIVKRYYRPDEAGRARDRKKLRRIVDEVLDTVPGAQLSSDSRYTEVDLAIDWNEEAHLSLAKAKKLEAGLRARGATAVRSSVHINTWLGGFDKRTAAEDLLVHVAKAKLPRDLERFAYIGDAPNDAPMFGGFPLSFGVADVRARGLELDAWPAFVTPSRGATGFCELAAAILVAKELFT